MVVSSILPGWTTARRKAGARIVGGWTAGIVRPGRVAGGKPRAGTPAKVRSRSSRWKSACPTGLGSRPEYVRASLEKDANLLRCRLNFRLARLCSRFVPEPLKFSRMTSSDLR